MIAKCEGIVVRTTDYGESAKIVTIFSKELGKVTLMAHGAKKFKSKLSGVTQLFHFGHYLFHAGRGMGTLQQGETLVNFRNIQTDIVATAYATYFVELVDRTTDDGEKNKSLFDLLENALRFVDEGYEAECIKYIFELKMLIKFGVEPYLDGCVCCKCTSGNFKFSLEEGGFICQNCAPRDEYAIAVTPRSAKILRAFYHLDFARLGQIDLSAETKKEIKSIIDLYYERNVGINFKSKRFLSQLDSMNELVLNRK